MRKKKLYHSIDAPWGNDYLHLVAVYKPVTDEEIWDHILCERWKPPSDDECGWVPIRPPGYKPPPTCNTCGFQYSYGDQRMYERCHCQRKEDFWGYVKLAAGVVAFLVIFFLVGSRLQ